MKVKKKIISKAYFYIFLCKDKSLYCGSCKNLSKRENDHNAGRGSAYVRSRGGGKIIYSEKCKTWSHALKREAEVKKFTRLGKLALINKIMHI